MWVAGLLLVAGCKTAVRPPPSALSPVDAVVAAVLEEEGFGAKPFHLVDVREDGKQHFVATYVLGAPASPAEPSAHWILEVSIARGGGLIDPVAYADAADPSVPPPLGSRYVEVDRIGVTTSYAPPGMFTGFAFSTPDGRFDVLIASSNMLPEGVTAPRFDGKELGAKILARYRSARHD